MVMLMFSFFRLWVIVSLLVILHTIAFDLQIILAPDTLQVQYTPDDAYYYLVLARNFTVYGTWTFDSGLSVTSGFHPLLAYLLSLVYFLVHPTSSEFVRYGIAFTSIATLVAALFTWAVGLKQNKPYYMLFLALLLSSKNITFNSVSIMEWPLVVLLACFYFAYFYWNCDHIRKRDIAILFLLGLAGSLSRSDFGLMPLSLFIACLILCSLSKKIEAIYTSFAGLVGATIGLLLVFAHNYFFTGSFLQSSARMKDYWAQTCNTVEALPLILNLLSIDSFLNFLLLVALLVILVSAVLLIFAKNIAQGEAISQILGLKALETPRKLTASVAAVLSIVGYLVLYSHSGEIQPWYTANLTVPMFTILAIVAGYVDNKINKYGQSSTLGSFIKVGISIVVVLIALHNIATINPIDTSHSPWPYQQIMLRAGNHLKQQTLDGRIGSWNAGIIGYYQGGAVINIDGLVLQR